MNDCRHLVRDEHAEESCELIRPLRFPAFLKLLSEVEEEAFDASDLCPLRRTGYP